MPLVCGDFGGVRRCSISSAAQSVSNSCARGGTLAQTEEPIRELFVVIGQNGADTDRAGALQVAQKPPRIGRRNVIVDADKDPVGGPIDRHEEVAA